MLKPYDVEQAAAEVESVPRREVAAQKPKMKKLFVLDTNVLMHDPTSLFRFEEHDIYLPMLRSRSSTRKKADVEVARNARQASRFLDEIVTGRASIENGIAAQDAGTASSRPGACSCRPRRSTASCRARSPTARPTTRSSPSSCTCRTRIAKREVILVSKDINMRIKARALGLPAEDYFNDKVLEDTDLLYTGVRGAAARFLGPHGKDMESWQKDGHTYYRVRGPLVPELHVNEFVYDENGRAPFYAIVKEVNGKTRCSRRCATTRTSKNTSGASPRATASRTSRSTC